MTPFGNVLLGAGRETRTLMVLPPADFESAASTGSAIPARKTGNYNSRPMLVSEFDYALPAELIAQHPAPNRIPSRRRHVDPAGRLAVLLFPTFPPWSLHPPPGGPKTRP